MKRHILIRCLSAGLLTGLGMGLLTGCQEEKNIDYNIEGMTESTQAESNGGKSGVAQFQDELSWEAEWTVIEEKTEWGEFTRDVVVDAKITLPEAEQMSVIEAVEPEFDAAYKEQIAKRVFENTDIYYGDIAHLPKQELAAMEEQFVVGSKLAIESPADEAEVDKMMHDYYTMVEKASDTYTKVEQYTENEYRGTYEGSDYKLTFVDKENDYDIRRVKEIHFEPKELHDICPMEMQDTEWIVCEPWMRGNMIENHCEISEEEALKEAQRFMEKLGLDYSVLAYSSPLVWGDATISNETTNDWIANGYVFSFDYGVDDISFVEYGMEEEYTNFWSTEQQGGNHLLYSMETRMQVYVTDKGVIQMRAYNPLETVGVSERVELLSLDTIKNIIKEQLETNYNDFRISYMTSDVRFDRMDLIYFRVGDKENPGHYSYVPTWRLSNLTEDEELHLITILNPILINAIDGSVIDFYDET